MGIFALLVSVVALICSFLFSFIGYGAVITPIAAIILSAMAKKKGADGTATAALVISVIALVIGAISVAACYACGYVANEVGNAITDSVNGFIG